jgi:hypothetical protein
VFASADYEAQLNALFDRTSTCKNI